MFFHFQPVSFSLEASPCRSPRPLATDVLSEKKSGVVLWISFLQCRIFFVSPPSFFHADFFFFFFFYYLELGCQEKEKKGSGKNQQRGSIRSSSVYEVFFKAFEEKHLSGGGMRPNCSQSLLILPVQSPHRAEGGGRGCRGWKLQTPSFDLLSALMSFESWLVFIKPFRRTVQGHSLTNY